MSLTKIVTVPMPQPTVGGMSLVELGKRLLDAAKRGETDTVRALMSNGAPFTTDWLGTSPLHFAAQNGHMGTAEVLLRAGISRDARTKVDRTPLHVACQEGHLDIVTLLIQNSADIDAKDMLKMTPLHWATDKGHDNIIDCLIKNGADINCTDKFERTPLDIAMANGRTDLAQALQLAQITFEQHTELAGVSEESTVTVETTEATESVIDTSHIKQEVVDAESSDSSSTSVLATLAALAEATGPINAQNMTSSEAMSWLENQGITMISTSEGNIITSALESGQSVQLTEAGKIALNFFRSQALSAEGTVTEDATIDSVVGDAGDQKVITIVTQPGSEIPTEDVPVLVTVATDDAEVSPEDQIVEATEEEAVIETEPASLEVAGVLDVDISTLEGHAVLQTDKDTDTDRLQKQLLEMQRQAEAYKEQLRQKEREAEDYRKQLSEMKTGTKTE